jgi:hypothetical protein
MLPKSWPRLEKARIGVIDLTHREDVTVAQMLARANRGHCLHNHFVGDRQKASRRGRKGGIGSMANPRRPSAKTLGGCWTGLLIAGKSLGT